MGPTGHTVTMGRDITAITARAITGLRITAITGGPITDPDMGPMPIMAGRITGRTGAAGKSTEKPGAMMLRAFYGLRIVACGCWLAKKQT
jgi:hypothetical protein